MIQPAAKGLSEGGPLAGVATGADGNLWMTSPGKNAIVRLTPSGSLTQFTPPASMSLASPGSIVAGPEGRLWFTAEGSSAIGSIGTDGSFRSYPLPTGAAPQGITTGPEGTVWFTESGTDSIGRISADGQVSTFASAKPGGHPDQITRGPDGNLWFTESAAPRVGMITPTGQITEYGSGEVGGPISAGPYGDLWFGTTTGIRSITPTGRLGAWQFTDDKKVLSMTQDREGNLWLGTHAEAGEGGGGSALINLTSPGQVYKFTSSPPTAGVAKNAKGLGAAWGQVRVTTAGGAAGQSCAGTVTLKVNGVKVGSRRFSALTDETRWIAVRLTGQALKVLARRGPLPGQATVALDGAATATVPVMLHRPPRRKSQR